VGNDGWLDPDTCGVQLGKFEQLTDMMNRSGPELEQLAQQLYKALATAGVDTAPAMEIARIARWANEVGPDLKRRNQLAHDLDKQKLAMVACVADGTFIKLPDRYSDQQGQVNGRNVADLVRRAAAGDVHALDAIDDYMPFANNKFFVQALLQSLGAKDLLRLPVDLANNLRLADPKDLDRQAKETREALLLLSKVLANGTKPMVGPGTDPGLQFLTALREAARGQYGLKQTTRPAYSGYQGLVLLLREANGTVRFSAQFMEAMGLPLIDVARGSDGPTGDLSHEFQLGNALDPLLDAPGAPKAHLGFVETDILTGLLKAAGTSRQASQVLLDYTPPGQDSNLKFLIHDHRGAWAATDHGAALGDAVKAATIEPDAVSTKLFEELYRTLGPDVLNHVTYKYDNTLGINGGHWNHLYSDDEKAKLDQLSGLRAAMGQVLVARLPEIMERLNNIDISGHLVKGSDQEERLLMALLADTVQDDQAFNALIKAQVGHLRVELDHLYKTGEDVTDLIHADAKALGRLLALRKAMMSARSGSEDATNTDFKDLINDGLGLVDVPGMDRLPKGVSDVANFGKNQLYEKVGDFLVTQMGDHSEANNTDAKRLTDEQAIKNLVKQLLVSSAAFNIKFSPKDLRGMSFARDGKIIPPSTWSDAQLERFIEWCRWKGFSPPVLSEALDATIDGVHDKSVQTLRGDKE
jgi:hypothetical protein